MIRAEVLKHKTFPGLRDDFRPDWPKEQAGIGPIRSPDRGTETALWDVKEIAMKFDLFKRIVSTALCLSLIFLLPQEIRAQSSAPSQQEMKSAGIDGPKAMGAGEKTITDQSGKRSKLWLYILGGAAVVGAVVAIVLLTKKKKAATGSIQVNSTPDGAKVFLDGTDTGKTTNAILTGIAAGNHALKLVRADYNDYLQTVSVQAGKTAQVAAELVPLDTAPGSIEVSSTPAGARIFLDGTDTGKTTAATLADIAPGSHALRLVLADYNDFQQDVTVQPAQTAHVAATMVPLTATTGIIEVNSTPSGAKVYLDNADTGKTTNAALTLLAPGNHTVLLTLRGYRDFSQQVTVAAGQTATVSASLVATGVLEPEMVRLPGGTFLMGSDSAESDAIERPVHSVTLSGFEIGKYEVTQEEFISVMNMNPSLFRDNVRNPVEQVSWYTAQQYIDALNAATGKSYRLPTEAEWEYACRAGTTGDRYGDINAVAWYLANAGDQERPVGQKLPNAFGLFDMLGNVSEWCSDWFGMYSASAQTNPRGPATGDRKILRGGSWYMEAGLVRASDRYANGPSLPPINWGDDLGFRVARDVTLIR